MEAYDIIMLVVLVAAIALGAYKGMAWQLASIASIFLSYLVAFQLRGVVAAQLPAEPPWNLFLAMLILYLGTSLVVWLIFRAVKEMIDRVKLKEFDHQIGGLFGAAKGVLLCVLITLFAVTLLDDARREQIIRSRSGRYIAILLDRSHSVLPDEIHGVLHPHLHKLDDSLDEDYERQNQHDDEPDNADSEPESAESETASTGDVQRR